MSMTMNRETYARLIEEDIEVLLKHMPRSLERDHIVAVLRESVRLNYDALPDGSRRWVDTYRNRS